MKICILIQAHKDFDFLKRLISRLRDEHIDIWLNIDKKASINLSEFKDCHIVDKRVDIKWGDISLCDSFFKALKEINDSNIPYDRIIYISGQHYPIIPTSKLVEFYSLEENKDVLFLEGLKIDNSNKFVSNRYKYNHYPKRYMTALSKIFSNRPFIKGYTPFFGSNWMSITLDASKYLVSKYEQDNFYDYFKYSMSMDEIIPQSILLSDASPFKEKINQNNFLYIDWSDHIAGKNKGNPNILTTKDFDKIIKSHKHFARKFDLKVDSKIIDMLDEYVDNYEKNSNCN